MLYRVGTERTREGEMKGDNGTGGAWRKRKREKTEGQWGGEESRGSEGGNGGCSTRPRVRQVGSSELKRNYRDGGVKGTIYRSRAGG